MIGSSEPEGRYPSEAESVLEELYEQRHWHIIWQQPQINKPST